MIPYDTCLYLVASIISAVMVAKLVRFLINWTAGFRVSKAAAEQFGGENKHWLYGNLDVVKDYSEEMLAYIRERVAENCYAYRVWLGPLHVMYILCHPKTIKILTNTTEPKVLGFAGAYHFVVPWLGDGLLISSGKKWHRNRKLLTPGFHFDVLKPYVDVYNKSTTTMLDELSKICTDGRSVDITPYISLCTLDIILKCAFTSDMDVQNQKNENPYVSAVNSLCTLMTKRTLQPLMFWDTLYYLTPNGRSYLRNIDYVHQVASDVINKRRINLKEESGIATKRYVDFLDILLLAKDEEGRGLTHKEIRDEVDTFLFEGHDTTSSAISWLFYTLASHPEHQHKCYDEVKTLMTANDSQSLQWDDLMELPYLTMCIKESMRLHSPVPFIGRDVLEDLVLPGVGTIPAKSAVYINIYGLHHNPHVWGEDHMDFKPERFNPEACKNRDPHAFLPFSAGPRYELIADESHKVEHVPEVVMRSRGIKLFFKTRAATST